MAKCERIELPIVTDPRGNLSFIEGPSGQGHVPFEVLRVYYLYDVPAGAERGGHAHKELHQLIVAMSGSFDIHLTNGQEKVSYHLSRPHRGLYVPPMWWREMDNFSGGCVCMVLASDVYKESDYYRDYDTFVRDATVRGFA